MAASAQEDYLAGDELDDLFQLLDGGFLDDDAIFNADVNAVVTEVMDNEKNKAVYRCQHCEIICKSQRGLTMHCNVEHTSQQLPQQILVTLVFPYHSCQRKSNV